MTPPTHRAAPVALTTVFILTTSTLAAPLRPSIGRLARLNMEDQPPPPTPPPFDTDELGDAYEEAEVWIKPGPVILTPSQEEDLAYASRTARYGRGARTLLEGVSQQMRTDDVRAVGYVLLIAIFVLVVFRKAIRRQLKTVREQREAFDLPMGTTLPLMRVRDY